MAEITSGSSFEPNNPTEQKLGYVKKKTRTPKSRSPLWAPAKS